MKKRKTVLFMGPDGAPLPAGRGIAQAPAELRERLQDAVEQLARTDRIERHRAHRLEGGKWSLWLEDRQGERHRFVLYTSALEDTEHHPPAPAPPRRLVVWRQYGHAQGSGVELIEASAFIQRNFTGRVRQQLLGALEKALAGRGASDETIEFVRDGVILRALAEDQMLQRFEAEVHLRWEE